VIKVGRLDGKRISFVLENDFEDSEFYTPYQKLIEKGAELTIVGLERGRELRGKTEGYKTRVDRSFNDTSPEDFDALVIPGGYSPDKLRVHEEAVSFVRGFRNKPLAAICHGPQLLISADLVRNKEVTSWPSVTVDLRNAGANWVDRELVVDGNLITSRKPSDLEAFTKAIIEMLR